MKNNELTDRYSQHPVILSLIESIRSDTTKTILVSGLTGSSKAMALAQVYQKTQNTHIIVLPEKEDAAYFYNDLVALTGENSVFFFPSTYKRSVQYEQTDPANIVLRTEVLNFLASGKRKCLLVTYPESLMEKVISRKNLKKNTFLIKKGDKISLEFLEEMLREYNFLRTDFVYEPGQYSIRGSIADVFSYSADMPYRIDFFGEEVDSIRSFNTDDQLSVELMNEISVIPNIQDLYIEEIKDTFFDFVPPSSMIWIDDAGFIKEKVNNIFTQTTSREEAGQISDKKEIVITGSRLIDECKKFRIAEFGNRSTGYFTDSESFLFSYRTTT